jgi:hypothetical protein
MTACRSWGRRFSGVTGYTTVGTEAHALEVPLLQINSDTERMDFGHEQDIGLALVEVVA